MNEKNKKLLFILIFFAILYIIFQITVPTGHTIQNVQPTFSWHNQFVKNEHKLSTNKSPLENYSSELIRLERLVNHLKNSEYFNHFPRKCNYRIHRLTYFPDISCNEKWMFVENFQYSNELLEEFCQKSFSLFPDWEILILQKNGFKNFPKFNFVTTCKFFDFETLKNSVSLKKLRSFQHLNLQNADKEDIIDRLAILHAYEHGALEIMRIVIKYDKNQLQVSNIVDFAEFSSKFENLKKIVKIKNADSFEIANKVYINENIFRTENVVDLKMINQLNLKEILNTNNPKKVLLLANVSPTSIFNHFNITLILDDVYFYDFDDFICDIPEKLFFSLFKVSSGPSFWYYPLFKFISANMVVNGGIRNDSEIDPTFVKEQFYPRLGWYKEINFVSSLNCTDDFIKCAVSISEDLVIEGLWSVDNATQFLSFLIDLISLGFKFQIVHK